MRWGLSCLVLALSLAGCEWNERTLRFSDYAEYAANDVSRSGLLPTDLLPRSAKGISILRNIDTTEVEVTFAFDPRDEEDLVAPFLDFEQRRMRLAVKEGIVPAGALTSPAMLLLRCGEGAMEFLQVTDHRIAHYWTSWDEAQRARACTNNATGVAGQ